MIDWNNSHIVMHPLNASKAVDTSYLITGIVTDDVRDAPEMISIATINMKSSKNPFSRFNRSVNLFGLVVSTKELKDDGSKYAMNELPCLVDADRINLRQYLSQYNSYKTDDGEVVNEVVYYKKTAFESSNIDTGGGQSSRVNDFTLLFSKDDDPRKVFRECVHNRVGIPFPQGLSDVLYDYISSHKYTQYADPIATKTIEGQLKDNNNHAIEFRPCEINYGNTVGYKIKYNFRGLVGLIGDLISDRRYIISNNKNKT